MPDTDHMHTAAAGVERCFMPLYGSSGQSFIHGAPHPHTSARVPSANAAAKHSILAVELTNTVFLLTTTLLIYSSCISDDSDAAADVGV